MKVAVVVDGKKHCGRLPLPEWLAGPALSRRVPSSNFCTFLNTSSASTSPSLNTKTRCLLILKYFGLRGAQNQNPKRFVCSVLVTLQSPNDTSAFSLSKNIIYLTVNLPEIIESTLKYDLTPTSISVQAKAGKYVL